MRPARGMPRRVQTPGPLAFVTTKSPSPVVAMNESPLSRVDQLDLKRSPPLPARAYHIGPRGCTAGCQSERTAGPVICTRPSTEVSGGKAPAYGAAVGQSPARRGTARRRDACRRARTDSNPRPSIRSWPSGVRDRSLRCSEQVNGDVDVAAVQGRAPEHAVLDSQSGSTRLLRVSLG